MPEVSQDKTPGVGLPYAPFAFKLYRMLIIDILYKVLYTLPMGANTS